MEAMKGACLVVTCHISRLHVLIDVVPHYPIRLQACMGSKDDIQDPGIHQCQGWKVH